MRYLGPNTRAVSKDRTHSGGRGGNPEGLLVEGSECSAKREAVGKDDPALLRQRHRKFWLE